MDPAGGWEIDAVWAAFVLIVYLCCDPRSRPLLAEVEAASVRLRDWTIATCGDSSSMLFELLTGMGA